MSRNVYVIVGPQGSGKPSVARALLRGLAQTSVVACVGYDTFINPFSLGAVLLTAPPALLLDEVGEVPSAELLERLAQPFTHDTVVAERMMREPVVVATPWLAITCPRVVGSLKGHPFLKEVRVS